ncbi:hypothetical protein [Paraburkholderia mimosarum]|uniref:hypothetical protein n=1 Tax=Paraburkholderia mimosarum TaxID=312026 RepID=UPI0012DD0D26|nr:hypothetical protein [Paraburkholderia mimosarum]
MLKDLENDRRPLPLSALRLVASDASGDFEYRISPDVHDYIERGNRYTTSPERARGCKTVELIKIDSRSLVARSARVGTLHARADPLSPEVAACSSPLLTSQAQRRKPRDSPEGRCGLFFGMIKHCG